MDERHTDELRNVDEGDIVTIETTAGRLFREVECVSRQTQRADPRTGEIRQSQIWQFEVADRDLTVSIVDGLRSSPEDPDFPKHKEASLGNVGEYEGWVTVGYFDVVDIHDEEEFDSPDPDYFLENNSTPSES